MRAHTYTWRKQSGIGDDLLWGADINSFKLITLITSIIITKSVFAQSEWSQNEQV